MNEDELCMVFDCLRPIEIVLISKKWYKYAKHKIIGEILDLNIDGDKIRTEYFAVLCRSLNLFGTFLKCNVNWDGIGSITTNLSLIHNNEFIANNKPFTSERNVIAYTIKFMYCYSNNNNIKYGDNLNEHNTNNTNNNECNNDNDVVIWFDKKTMIGQLTNRCNNLSINLTYVKKSLKVYLKSVKSKLSDIEYEEFIKIYN